MAYPTPSIYTYRVKEVAGNGNKAGLDTYYVPEFSTDAGVTWKVMFSSTFQSLTEAFNAIGGAVTGEAQFRIQYLQASKFNNEPIVPTVTTYSYPPA